MMEKGLPLSGFYFLGCCVCLCVSVTVFVRLCLLSNIVWHFGFSLPLPSVQLYYLRISYAKTVDRLRLFMLNMPRLHHIVYKLVVYAFLLYPHRGWISVVFFHLHFHFFLLPLFHLCRRCFCFSS